MQIKDKAFFTKHRETFASHDASLTNVKLVKLPTLHFDTKRQTIARNKILLAFYLFRSWYANSLLKFLPPYRNDIIKVSDYASPSFANDTQEIEWNDTNLALPQVTVHADLFRFLISDLFHPWSSYFYLVHGNSTLSSLIPLPFIYVSARHPVALIEREIPDVAKTFRVLETRRVLQAIRSTQSTLELQIFWPSRAATISIILLRTLIIDDSDLNHGHARYIASSMAG